MEVLGIGENCVLLTFHSNILNIIARVVEILQMTLLVNRKYLDTNLAIFSFYSAKFLKFYFVEMIKGHSPLSPSVLELEPSWLSSLSILYSEFFLSERDGDGGPQV